MEELLKKFSKNKPEAKTKKLLSMTIGEENETQNGQDKKTSAAASFSEIPQEIDQAARQCSKETPQGEKQRKHCSKKRHGSFLKGEDQEGVKTPPGKTVGPLMAFGKKPKKTKRKRTKN